MSASLGRVLLYTKHVDDMIAFYGRLFGYTPHSDPEDRIIELRPSGPGAILMLHPAARSQKQGQAQVKLVFDVEDVEAFCAHAADNDLPFGSIHNVPGYSFANAKDPSGNSIQVSSRAFV